MRTKSAQVTAVLGNPSHSARAIVLVDSSDRSTSVELSAGELDGFDPVLSVDFEQSVDSHRTARVRLRRQAGARSLAPLVTTGPLFGLGLGGEAVVDVGRFIRIDVELTPADFSVIPAGLRETVFEGYIDEVTWPDEEMLLVCTDKAARLRDTWIERERVYAFAQGVNATAGVYVWSANLHVLQLGDLVVPSDANFNGHFYKVTTATSAQSVVEPTWPTGSGATVVSGGVTLTEAGAVNETGTPIETVIEQVLADNGLSSVNFQCPVSPSWNVRPYLQQRESVWDALQAMADQLGWVLRFEWDASYLEYALVLKDPGRASATVHRVLTDRDEVECTDTTVDVWSIRNVVRVIYSDSVSREADGSPTRVTWEVSDATSIAKYGRRFMEIAEGDSSAIDTAAEADRMARAALEDLREPQVGVSVAFAIDPYLELGDRLQLPADGLRWTSAQVLAVQSLKHSISADGARTSVTLRGRPASGLLRWLEKAGEVNLRDVHDISLVGSINSTRTAPTIIGGTSVLIAGDKLKSAHAAGGYELHVGTTAGFTPSAATLKAAGQASRFELADLVPGKGYYLKVVPYALNAQKPVRGSPSAAIAFTAGRAKAGHYDATSTQSHLPLNGNFEHASDDITAAPPDHWTVAALGGETESYGASGSVYSSVDADKGRIINLRAHASQRGRILSSPFEVRRGVRAFNIYLAIRRLTGSGSGSPYDLLLDVFGYSDAALSSQIINYTVTLSGSASGPYPSLSTWYSAVVKFGADYSTIPDNVNFLQLALRRSTAGSTAVAWDIGDVYVQEADFAHAIIDQPAWVAPTFATNWGNVGGSWRTVKYMKDSLGFVRLQGMPKVTTATLTTLIFTLPTGYRPAAQIQFPARMGTNALSYVEIRTDGTVHYAGSGGGVLADAQAGLSLEGINFDTR